MHAARGVVAARRQKGSTRCRRLVRAAALQRPDVLRVRQTSEESDEERQAKLLTAAVVVSVVVLIGAAVVLGWLSDDDPETDLEAWKVRWVWSGAVVVWLVLIGGVSGFIVKKGESRIVWFAQVLSLLATALIGIVIPVSVMLFFGSGFALIREGSSLSLLGRLLQTGFVIFASLLPALLFYLFDRSRLGTQRQQFQQAVFRLDPHVVSIADVESKYGATLNEAYGDPTAESGRLRRGTRWPILFATAVISVGWIFTLLPVGEAEINQPVDLIGLFDPPQRAAVFGFLGAYFYALTLVSRNYVRGDLRPKTYTAISVRIITVTIFAWVSEALLDDGQYLYAAMFVIGILPDTFWTVTQEFTRSLADRVRENHPLTVLEGLDLYDRARLLDEGVTNVQGLAKGDLVRLMVETRIPPGRLVDWVDQAILYLHLNRSSPLPQPARWSLHRRRCSAWDTAAGIAVRHHGIRTASDLLTALEVSLDPAQLLSDLELSPAFPDALYDEEWVEEILHWRCPMPTTEQTITVSAPPKRRLQRLYPIETRIADAAAHLPDGRALVATASADGVPHQEWLPVARDGNELLLASPSSTATVTCNIVGTGRARLAIAGRDEVLVLDGAATTLDDEPTELVEHFGEKPSPDAEPRTLIRITPEDTYSWNGVGSIENSDVMQVGEWVR